MLTKNQIKEMDRVFPNGWDSNDIPIMWRIKSKVEELKQILEDDYEDEKADYHPRPEEEDK